MNVIVYRAREGYKIYLKGKRVGALKALKYIMNMTRQRNVLEVGSWGVEVPRDSTLPRLKDVIIIINGIM